MIPPETPFDAPWQAQLFGLTVALADRGVFAWGDWTHALGAEIAEGRPYWQAWLGALESMLAERGIASADTLGALADQWHDAAHATPHGQPIELRDGG